MNATVNDVAVAVVCCLAPVWAQPSADVSSILQKTASAYRQITDYVIEVTQTKTSFALTGAQDSGKASPIPSDHRPGAGSRILLARSGKMFHYEVTDSMTALRAVVDSEHTWLYRADLKEYTVEPAEPWPIGGVPGGQGIDGMEWKLFGKFRAIAGMAGRAKLIKDDVPPDKTCSGPTAIIEVDVGDKKEPSTERLRIDTRTGLVCESSTERLLHVRVTPARYLNHIVWDYRRMAEPPNAGLFEFVPPKEARQVRRFHTRRSDEMPNW